jgi:hypothetical protein
MEAKVAESVAARDSSVEQIGFSSRPTETAHELL